MSHHKFEGEHGQVGTQAKMSDAQVFAISNSADNKLFDHASKSQLRETNDRLQGLGFASGDELFASNQKSEQPIARSEARLTVWRDTDGQGHRKDDDLLLYHDWERKTPRNQDDNLLLHRDSERQKQTPEDLSPHQLEPAQKLKEVQVAERPVNRTDNGTDQYLRFDGARPISLDDVPEKFKANRADGSMQIVNSDGVITFWPNGSINVKRFDGTGYAYNPDGKGGYEYKQWGKSDRDNFSSKYDKASDSLTEVDGQGTVVTRWNNGSELCQRADGTGYSKKFMPTHNYMTKTEHWGPKPEDNYTQIYNVITKMGQIWGKKSS